MKNVDVKKLIILILIIVIAAVAIFFVINKVANQETKANEEETKIANEASIDYITRLTLGVGSNYNGIDILFKKDRVTYDDLNAGNILTVAYEYAVNNLNTGISSMTIQQLKNANINIDDYTILTGDVVKTAVKEIFGIDFEHQSYDITINYNYSYTYLEEFDVYLRKYTKLNYNTDNFHIDYKTVKTTKKGDKLLNEIAVAYIYKTDSKYYYTKDAENEEIIYESDKQELQEDKLDEFTHYTITLKKVDNKYVFESIEKNK